MTQNISGSKLRVLLLYVTLSSFVERDIDVLRSRYHVVAVNCGSLSRILMSMWWVLWADCLFCWFGSLRFLPAVLVARALGKKVVIISGGYDVANVPEIRYGNMYPIVSRYLGRLLFRMAHAVAAVSCANAEEAQKNAKVPPSRLRLIYHGFYVNSSVDEPSTDKKDRLVLTVGHADMSTIYRKGLLAVAKVSRLLPDVSFVIAGPFEDEAIRTLRNGAGENVTFTGYVSKEELHTLFARAKVYLQPSIHEAFGCSVAEAMLYNCIPVVSKRFALPEVVGESGLCVDPDDLDGIASTVRLALNSEIQIPESPSQRIIRKFPMSNRRALLLEMVEDTCSGL